LGGAPWFFGAKSYERYATTTNHSIFNHVHGQSKVKTITINQKLHVNSVPLYLRRTALLFSADC
jgi:hypothetical protein